MSKIFINHLKAKLPKAISIVPLNSQADKTRVARTLTMVENAGVFFWTFEIDARQKQRSKVLLGIMTFYNSMKKMQIG